MSPPFYGYVPVIPFSYGPFCEIGYAMDHCDDTRWKRGGAFFSCEAFVYSKAGGETQWDKIREAFERHTP